MDLGFDPGSAITALLDLVQLIAINMALSGDNALLIAMATRGLPANEARTTMIIGTAGAVVIRIGMGAVAISLLQIPYLKIAAGLLLLVIALRLTLETDGDDPDTAGIRAWSGRLGMAATIVAADAIMSLDNVVAVASVANGNMTLLVFGLALSIPVLVWGSTLIQRFLGEHRMLILASGIYLGWLSGAIMISDPVLVEWMGAQAVALPLTLPLACAIFVFWQYLILRPVPPAHPPG